MRVSKVCLNCSTEFQVWPSRAETAKYCSPKCSQVASVGKGRHYTAESRARLTGRPKTSVDVPRTCPTCDEVFVRPDYDRARYCSSACAHRRPDRKPLGHGSVEKKCAHCGKTFFVYPSRADRAACCSLKCAAMHKRTVSDKRYGDLKSMEEVECAWLAGIFDGEGSIVIVNRKRALPSCKIQVTNTVKPLIDKIFEVTGVGRLSKVDRGNPRHAVAYHWVVGGADAIELIRRMRPWLIAKAERADAALAGESFPRQSRWDHIVG